MKKYWFIVIALFYFLPAQMQAQSWFIQVGVFETKVDINYFNKLGSNVYYARDAYGFHRYYKGIYEDESEAKKLLKEFKMKGFIGTLVPKSTLGPGCICYAIPVPKPLMNTLKHIFFDFDASSLRSDSRTQLNHLVQIMRDFPTYKVKLRGHTDAKGTNSYNDALSMRRVNSAYSYLSSRGISSSRIQKETLGEENPIAKNELTDGSDTEVGRQFNRRVEIVIINEHGDILNEIVDEIEVPKDLVN